jgi:hypothetical protein
MIGERTGRAGWGTVWGLFAAAGAVAGMSGCMSPGEFALEVAEATQRVAAAPAVQNAAPQAETSSATVTEPPVATPALFRRPRLDLDRGFAAPLRVEPGFVMVAAAPAPVPAPAPTPAPAPAPAEAGKDAPPAGGAGAAEAGGRIRYRLPDPSLPDDRPAYGRQPLPSFIATLRRDAKEAPLEYLQDVKEVFLKPIPMAILLGSIGGVIPSYKYADPKVRSYYGGSGNDYPHTPSRQTRDIADFLGAPEHVFAAAAACYFISIPAQDEKFYDFSKTLVLSLGVTAPTIGILKGAVNDRSPNGKRFGFPSGHASFTFCFASVVHEYYGPLAATPFYATGVFTSWGRLWDKEHRFTDVWYGALIGTVIGHSIGHRHAVRFMDMDVSATVAPGNVACDRADGAVGLLSLSRSF